MFRTTPPRDAWQGGEFLVRDSKDPQGPLLAFSASGWASLVTFAKGQTV